MPHGKELPGLLGIAALVFSTVALSQQSSIDKAIVADSPEVLFQELFVAVEQAQILPDSKAFADATPLDAPAAILADYRAQRPDTREALQAFVATHFALPTDAGSRPPSAAPLPIAQHIDLLWDQLTRRSESVPPYGSLLALPHPYVVPGGRFRELYYWDSYFTMLGLAQSGRRDLLEDMVGDFAYLLDTYGRIPNGTRTYYLSRSQPPFFFEMVGLLTPKDPVRAYARFLPQLKREYAFWMQGASGLQPGAAERRVVALADGAILNRYWDDRDTPRDESYRQDIALAQSSERDPHEVYRDLRAAAESGWDFGSRWLADGHTLATIDTTQILPVDLNSLLFGLEQAIAAACQRSHQTSCASEFSARGAARRAAMNHYLWDPDSGTYLDYHWTSKARQSRVTAATLYPLFLGLASKAQARRVAHATRQTLLAPGGLATSTLKTGQQWDIPNGWAPLQWIAVAGLRQYGENALAGAIACRWMVSVNSLYDQSQKLVEKYDVVTPGRSGGGGEYTLQDGFGWTNGVMRRLMALYPAEAAYSRAEQCQQE
jgi:alpha,alpha-trehalase